MRRGADEAALDEFDYSGVIHRCVGDVVFPGEWGDDDVRNPEP